MKSYKLIDSNPLKSEDHFTKELSKYASTFKLSVLFFSSPFLLLRFTILKIKNASFCVSRCALIGYSKPHGYDFTDGHHACRLKRTLVRRTGRRRV